LKETRETLPTSTFSSNLLTAAARSKITALPVAFSTPVLFYNKRLFREAGLDVNAPPRTWQEMQDIAGKLADKGIACPYTTSWPVWVHIDNLSARSGVPVADKKGQLDFNGLMQVKHIAMLATWYKARYFHTFGRADEADQHFAQGECAMLTTDARAGSLLKDAGFELGVAPLPYHDDTYGGPRNTLAGGASIWVGSGYKPAEYKAAARFLRFLLAPDMQVELARVGGFLPLTEAARKGMQSPVFQDNEQQILDVAYATLQGKGADEPLRVSAVAPLRLIVDEELEKVWTDNKPAKLALDTAVSRGNAVLAAKPALKKATAF
jgi:sn-glycerol 3-phosphate transport system substrate-binding protein